MTAFVHYLFMDLASDADGSHRPERLRPLAVQKVSLHHFVVASWTATR